MTQTERRWREIERSMGRLSCSATKDVEWYQFNRKNGVLGSWRQRFTAWYTPLNTCHLCGKTSTPKKVHERIDCDRWNVPNKRDFETPNKNVLCCGCWNKVRALVKKADETQECRRLINKLEKEIRNERKNQNNRRAA